MRGKMYALTYDRKAAQWGVVMASEDRLAR
jgi:hypothetical protein